MIYLFNWSQEIREKTAGSGILRHKSLSSPAPNTYLLTNDLESRHDYHSIVKNTYEINRKRKNLNANKLEQENSS